jgi:hypothetical protein
MKPKMPRPDFRRNNYSKEIVTENKEVETETADEQETVEENK